MPYAAGVYTVPPGTEATTLTAISSSDYNAFVDDIEAAQNASRPVTAGGTGGSSVITGWDGLAKKGTDIATASSINLTTATGPSLSLTGVVTVTAVTLAEGSFRLVRAAGTFQITASASLLCNGSSSVNMSVVAEDLLVFRGGAGGVVTVSRIGATATVDATTSVKGVVKLAFGGAYNIGLAASVATSALTISLKGVDGNDPSASNPVVIPFRSATAATGTPDYLTATAATSLVISSGSTMGFASAVAGRLWIVAFDDAGTLRLGAVNCLSGIAIKPLRNGIYSSTAEGGSGGADSAQVIYTGTAVTSKGMTVLGYLEATEATAGTWATAPSVIKLWQAGDALPGDRLQLVPSQSGTVASGTTLLPLDNTIPQITEGIEFFASAITPMSAVNVLSIEHGAVYTSTAINNISAALFQDSGADALSANDVFLGNAGSAVYLGLKHVRQAGSASSLTFRLRAGGSIAGTTRINATGTTQIFGGVAGAFFNIEELMA